MVTETSKVTNRSIFFFKKCKQKRTEPLKTYFQAGRPLVEWHVAKLRKEIGEPKTDLKKPIEKKETLPFPRSGGLRPEWVHVSRTWSDTHHCTDVRPLWKHIFNVYIRFRCKPSCFFSPVGIILSSVYARDPGKNLRLFQCTKTQRRLGKVSWTIEQSQSKRVVRCYQIAS